MKKGQEEAPIELLLGVTILTFVIVLGFYVYENLSGSLYEQKMRDSLSTFARNLELVYQGGEGTSKIVEVDFSGTGGSTNVNSIRLLQGLESTCERNIGKKECLQLMAVTVDTSGSHPFMIEILNIPSQVHIILLNAPSNCPNLNDLDANTWKQSAYSECGWKAMTYSFKITKTAANEIYIEQLS